MNAPLVSVLIPTYNRPEYLRRALISCLEQTFSSFEIIVTDNSTNADSAAIVASLKDPRIRYCKNEGNIGAVGSSNRAVSLAGGKYLKFLMDDDLLKPRCLELMVKAMEENPPVGIAMAPMELIDETDARIFPRFYVFRTMEYRYRYRVGDSFIARRQILKDFLTRDYPCTVPSGIMFRTEAFRQAGWFDAAADFAGDLDMCMRISAHWDSYYIDEVLSSWRFMTACHTASLHQTGLKISVFYDITRKCLANESVNSMFRDEWKKTVRDSMFFCSCRALLNGLAGIRARDPGLILGTVGTMLREDPSVINILRLPVFVIQQIWISIFPPKMPPPRE